jgi:GTP diphosphokinase / guanosine-3',5'-bis(diphosphate) 3'-diphosphatase
LDRWHPRRWQLRLPLRETGDPVAGLIRAHRRVHARGDVRAIRAAYHKAAEMHRGQMRKSGDEYITHPLAVAEILAELGMDTTTLVAALLHDTVEDTSYTLPALEADFDAGVALLVDGVTKFDKAFFGDTAEVETVRKMLVKAGQDVRVLIIKLADRLHNMRTLDARSPASRVRIARATLDVLVPLCDRLGIQVLKRSLEDTVLYALEPEAFGEIDTYVAGRHRFTRTVDRTVVATRKALAAAHISAHVGPRHRHYYSIWKDTLAQGIPVDHDLPRIVVVVDGPQTDCYTALGTLHAMWRPVPGRFKDFIASPKNNLYRSLHTTVIGPGDRPVEVLIRTEAMHHAAEFGIAANFRDPQAAARLAPPARAEQLAWLHRVVDWQETVDDAAKFIDALRCEIGEQQIHVFTEAGQAVLLPTGATPVDLAYTVDPNLGHVCVGASINGRLAPLSSLLDEGDVVEIITRGNSGPLGGGPGPAREWLEFVRSPQARLEINRWFATPEPVATVEQRMRLGRATIGLALHEHGRRLVNERPLRDLASDLGYPDVGALLVAVADHRLPATEVANRLVAIVDRPI